MRHWTGDDVRVLRNDVLDESRLDFARRVSCSVRSIERWEAGGPISRQSSRALHDALSKAPAQAQAEFKALRSQPGTVDSVKDGEPDQTAKAGDATNRWEVLKLIGVTAVAPDALVEVAAEVMDFTRRAGASSVGEGVLEQLELAVIDLNHSYSQQPPAELFAVARWYRHQVGKLIERPHTLRQGRLLYTYAGWLSELLARMARALGELTLAETYCVDAYQHGWQAEDDELCAWAMEAKASIALYNHRPRAALSAALKGAAHAPAGQPVAVLLMARAARAHARLGQREDFRSTLWAARNAHEHLPIQTSTHFGQDTSPDRTSLPDLLVGHAASSCVWLGLAEEAQRHAEHTLELIHSAPVAHQSPIREAIARIDLGLARTVLAAPDEACALGTQALRWEPPAGHPVHARALELDAALQRRYPDLPQVAEFHERCHQPTRAT